MDDQEELVVEDEDDPFAKASEPAYLAAGEIADSRLDGPNHERIPEADSLEPLPHQSR